jgi:hypothetical protein
VNTVFEEIIDVLAKGDRVNCAALRVLVKSMMAPAATPAPARLWRSRQEGALLQDRQTSARPAERWQSRAVQAPRCSDIGRNSQGHAMIRYPRLVVLAVLALVR